MQAFGDDRDEVSIQIKMLQSLILSIANQEQWFGTARVGCDALTGFELAGGFSLAAEAADVFLVLIVFVKPVLAVSIGDVDMAIGPDRDRRRVVLGALLIFPRFHRHADRPDDGAV